MSTTHHPQWRLLLAVTALSLLATAITAGCGFYLSRIALEKRILQAQSQNLASLVTSLKLPLNSQRLLLNLKQVSNCDVLITRGNQIIHATIPELVGLPATTLQQGELSVNQTHYRTASHPLTDDTTLWLLLPSSVLSQDLRSATKTMGTLGAIAALLAVAISIAIAHAYASLWTKSRDADRRLAKAQHAAMAGKLSASVVHELRNPLSGIKMNAQILEDELEGNTSASEPLDMIVHEIDRIDHFLKGLTAVPDKDIIPAQQDTLQSILQNTLQLMEQKASKEKVALRLVNHVPPDFLAPCNSLHLRQILLNLIANALDASPTDSLITITASPTPLTLTVQDQGPGVHPQDGEDIFAPFVSQKEGGFGLGLHISQKIASQYGATLTWENLPQGGAAFTLAFPA